MMGTMNRLFLLLLILLIVSYTLFKLNGGGKLLYDDNRRHKYQSSDNMINHISHSRITGIVHPGESDENIIILYNRVPKTGSTSFMNVVYNLHAKNKFSAAYVNVSSRSHRWKFTDQYKFAQNITRWKNRTPGIYHGHFPFLNFIKLGMKQPLYINIIRDPLERFVSHYYFLRYGDTYLPNKIRNRQGDQTTFDECVRLRKAECHPDKLWVQIPYFCGSDPFCWKPGNKAALHRAQRNVLNHYFLVGTTRKLGQFIEMLERTLPRIFHGASTLFGKGVHIRKTKTKKPLIVDTVEYFKISKAWKLENEFYKFVESLFNDIYENSKGGSSFSYVKVRP